MLKAILKFSRLRILVTCYALAFVGSAASGSVTFYTVMTIFVISAWYIHAASANDYADRHIDQINLKNAIDRPLVAKNISHRQLWIIHYSSGCLALLFSSFYGTGAILLTLLALIINYAYSFKPMRVSDRGILSQLLLAFVYVYGPLSLGYWSTESTQYPWLLSFGLYIGFAGRLLLKDFRDVKGDKKFGKMTFVLRHGQKTTCLLSGAFGLAALVLISTAIDFSPGTLSVLLFGQVIMTALLVQLAATKKIEKQMKLIALIAKTANVTLLTVLVFYLCKNQPNLSSLEIQLLPAALGLVMLIPILVTCATTRKYEHA